MADNRGHVPEENLHRYRRLLKIAEQFGTLGGTVSGLGEYEDANWCWAQESKYHKRARELRVELPEKPNTT